jgi:hypothetical protein
MFENDEARTLWACDVGQKFKQSQCQSQFQALTREPLGQAGVNFAH